MEVRVTAPGGKIDRDFIATLIDTFHANHKRTFGYDYKGEQQVEIINFCVSGFGMIERPKLPKLTSKSGAAKPKSKRAVHFDGSMRDTPVYDRAHLAPGTEISGPAIVEEFGSTTVVFPRQTLRVDDHGIMIIR